VESNKKVLIGTVGYQLLGNHSVGPNLLPKLQAINWPEGVVVDEMNWGPIAVVQYLESLETPFDRVVFLVAIERAHRDIGEISLYQWKGGLPDDKQIQACVGDAATGVISVENLLVIGEHFKVWPKEVYLIDVEPGMEIAGEQFTKNVTDQISNILELIKRVALNGVDEKMKILEVRGDTLFD
jgi:Ni,Fe-hydrogenase maturation factor